MDELTDKKTCNFCYKSINSNAYSKCSDSLCMCSMHYKV